MGARSVLPDRAAVPAVAFLAFAASYALALLVRTGFDPSRLVRAAPPFTNPAGALPSLTVLRPEFAFDGQFFYRLALSPFSSAAELGGVTFDLPALRGSRIGMGLVGYLLSAGQPDLAPTALLLGNVLLFGLLGLLVGRLAQSAGKHAACGLLLLIWPGFVYSFALDTAEILAATSLVGGLLAIRKRRATLAALGLVSAVITRESTVAIVAALWITAAGQLLMQRRRTRTARQPPPCDPGVVVTFVASSVAGVAVLLLQLYGSLQFGAVPLLTSGNTNLGVPLSGLADALLRALPPTSGGRILDATAILLIAAVLAVSIWGSLYSEVALPEKVACLASTVSILVITGPWISAPSSTRAATELAVMTVAVMTGIPAKGLPRGILAVAAGYAVAVWILTAGTMLVKMPSVQ